MDLRKLLTYLLVPVPYSIGLPDNVLAKTDKAKGLHYLIKDLDDTNIPEDPKSCMIIEDGNAIFHYMKQIPRNFQDIKRWYWKQHCKIRQSSSVQTCTKTVQWRELREKEEAVGRNLLFEEKKLGAIKTGKISWRTMKTRNN